MDSIVLQNFLQEKMNQKSGIPLHQILILVIDLIHILGQTYQSDSLGNTQSYSPFSNNIYGTYNSSESGRIGFSLINSLELKETI